MKFRVGDALVDMIEDGDRICAHVAKGEQFEPGSLAAWADLCKGGGTVLDVGAYTGLFAIGAAKMNCRVIAFEPMPFNQDRLWANAQANAVSDKIWLVRAAASDREGEATIRYHANVPFTSGASLVRKSGDGLAILTVAIDGLALDSLKAIKIDVERGEPLVLAGAKKTIERFKPPILIEVLDDQRKAAVKAALPGYRVDKEIDSRNWLMLPA